MGEPSGTEAEETARAATDLVGDGCIVRLADRRSASLAVVAVGHRDPAIRARLTALMSERRVESIERWAGQAMAKNLAFRLEHDAAADAVGLHGEEHSLEVHAAIVAPLRRGDDVVGALVVLRDSVDLSYSLREQNLVEEIALLDGPDESAPTPGGVAPDRILEHAAAGVWTTDLDGVTTYVNETASALVGLQASELVGRPMADFLDEEPHVIHARLSPTTERRDHRLLRADDVETWVSMTSAPLSNRRGRRVGTVSTLTDVSERKRHEVELHLRAAAHEAAAEMAECALAGESLERLMLQAAATAADILGAEYASVVEITPEGDEAVPCVVLGWDQGLVGRRLPIPERSPGWLCMDDDDPVVVDDFETVEGLARGSVAVAARVRSAVYVGIGNGSGVLAVASPRVGAFSGQDLAFLRTMAAVLASRWRPSPTPLAAVPA